MDNSTLILVLAGVSLIPILLVIWLTAPKADGESQGTKVIEKALQEQHEKPELNRPYYDEAYGFLMDHIKNNLNQNKNIYFLTVIIILAGFFMIGFGIVADQFSVSDAPETTKSLLGGPWPAVVAGLVTEFIAATILFVYKSVVQQTTDYSRTLERMTSIRMALQILDDLADDDEKADDPTDKAKLKQLQADTKAKMAMALIHLQHGTPDTKIGSDVEHK